VPATGLEVVRAVVVADAKHALPWKPSFLAI